MSKTENFVQFDFQKMQSNTDFDKIGDNACPLIINGEIGKDKVIKKRNGSLVSSIPAPTGSTIQGITEFVQYSGYRELRAVSAGNIYKGVYSGSNVIWSQIASSQFNTTDKVQMANLNNRIYYVAPNTPMFSEDINGQFYITGQGGNEIQANNIIVSQNTLLVGNVTAIGGPINSLINVTTSNNTYQIANPQLSNMQPVAQSNRTYFSYSGTPTLSDQLYTPYYQQNTMATSLNYIDLLQPTLNSYDFPIVSLSYHWTKEKMYSFDVTKVSVYQGLNEVAEVGCCSNRAATSTNNGWLVWMDTTGRPWAYAGVGQPKSLYDEISDGLSGQGLIQSINPSSLPNVCSGSIYNYIYFYIGTINYFGQTLNNIILKGTISQNLPPYYLTIKWSLDQYPEAISQFVRGFVNGQQQLFAIAANSTNVYLMNQQGVYKDGNTNVNLQVYSKFYSFGDPLSSTEITDLIVKYKPTTTNSNINISYATDLNLTYTPTSNATLATKGGVINMYDSNSNKLDDVGKILLPVIQRFRTISFLFQNNDNNNCEISAIGATIVNKPLDILPKSS